MGILEDVVVNAKSAVNAVGKKAGIMVDISKLRISAADLNREIAERYESLGSIVYDSQKTGNSVQELIEENVAAIDELYDQLDLINAQLLQFRNKVVCKNCGRENPQEAFFCSFCGTRLKEDVKDEEPVETVTAEKCGCGCECGEAPAQEAQPASEECACEETAKVSDCGCCEEAAQETCAEAAPQEAAEESAAPAEEPTVEE